MLLCDVIARIWPERAIDGVAGRPIVLVRDVEGAATHAALDLIEAGVGARVLVVTGEPAQRISGGLPVDAVVTAVVGGDKVASAGRK